MLFANAPSSNDDAKGILALPWQRVSQIGVLKPFLLNEFQPSAYAMAPSDASPLVEQVFCCARMKHHRIQPEKILPRQTAVQSDFCVREGGSSVFGSWRGSVIENFAIRLRSPSMWSSQYPKRGALFRQHAAMRSKTPDSCTSICARASSPTQNCRRFRRCSLTPNGTRRAGEYRGYLRLSSAAD